MTTKHTCNFGDGPRWGKLAPLHTCSRCDELLNGATPNVWRVARDSAERYHEKRKRAIGPLTLHVNGVPLFPGAKVMFDTLEKAHAVLNVARALDHLNHYTLEREKVK